MSSNTGFVTDENIINDNFGLDEASQETFNQEYFSASIMFSLTLYFW